MFLYKDSKTVSVRTPGVRTPRKENHPIFVKISPTVVIDTSMEKSLNIQHMKTSKFYYINTQVGLNISVLTTCTFMFLQVCTVELSFFNTTSGMHRRPFKCRHLVLKFFYLRCCPRNHLTFRIRQLWLINFLTSFFFVCVVACPM